MSTKSSRLLSAAGLSMAIALQGCQSVSAVSSALHTVENVRAGTKAYDAYSMGKDLKNAQPVFNGYEGVVGLAQIQPRDRQSDVSGAFSDDLVYLITHASSTVSAPLKVCSQLSDCPVKTMIVQFREEAPSNLVQRIASGDKVRGKLDYTDAATGKLVTEVSIEEADNYAAALKLINTSIATSMLKSFPAPDHATTQQQADAFNKFDVIRPDLKKVLASS